MSREIQKWFAHIDLDAFFASVEQLDHPEYKGKPVIVGGRPEDRRGVVSTASYEARKFGVHSAMPTYQAYKLCPQGIFVHGNYKRYSELSYQIMTIFKDYSPEVDQMSIDEAFIDLTGTEKLFGPPEETCLKIKQRVKQETGLTVSIGLASTKYIAKICSGYKKPDGFFKVEPGKETEFMLGLPLEKVWGVGEKTLNNLHTKGIYSTNDIYTKDLPTLQFLFGNSTAGFLYDVVRGGKNELFRKETKSHSISAEKTFPYDIIDSYTLETEILELAQDVMFRLLKEKGYSRTAFLKLRYDDFSTYTIQKTFDQNIRTLDSFYEILTDLFHSKWEKGRGIRLIGVGFENIENEEKPFQQSLFENNETKKQEVEKAILKLNQKHPEIKVQKARTLKLKALLLFLFVSIFLNLNAKFYAENKTSNTGAGAILPDTLSSPESTTSQQYLFNIDKDDKENLEFNISGFWNIDFSTGLLTTFGNSTPFGFSLITPIFKQEVELNTSILLKQHWFFDTSFADGFEKNTFSVGYKNGAFIDKAVLSNRNIGMVNDYSAALFGHGLQGGQNQAPGFSMQFKDPKNQRWKGDFVIRYDMTTSKKAVFYGLNNVTDQNINLKNFLYGKKFVLPENESHTLNNIKAIYVENQNGSYVDLYHKKYNKLSSSQYAVYQNQSIIEFTNDALTTKQGNSIPTILVTFLDDSNVDSIITATGDYSNEETFAGKIQDYFNSENTRKIDLSKYTYKLENKIDNSKALVIQNSAGFSPYLCADIYDCGIINQADVNVISESTEQLSKYFSAIHLEENNTQISNFLYESHYYAQLVNLNAEDSSLQLPENRYPYASNNPKLYLNLDTNEDMVIRVRNYSPVSSLQIGTKAVEGTVFVYKNGILDSGASYNPNTGAVTLSSAINDTDKIVIQYQEDSEDNSGGSLASGLGFIYNISPELIYDTSITTRWPLSVNEKFSTPENGLNGFVDFSNGITYNHENLTISDKLSLSLQNPDSTQNLLANTNNQFINETYYLSSSSGYETKTTPYIDAYLEEDKNCTVNNFSGIQDSYISGYAIPLSWNFTDKQNLENLWASADIKLDSGYLLSNSSQFEIAFKPKFTEITSTDNFDVYLQLGVKASSNFYGEDISSIRTWKITQLSSSVPSPLKLSDSNWQTVQITLNDYDRALLTSNNDARIIIIKKSPDSNNLTGQILTGPYEPYVQNIFIQSNPNIETRTFTELTPPSPSSQNLSITKNYSSRINWNIEPSSVDQIGTDSLITTITNFKAADFSNYKSINLDFAIQADSINAQTSTATDSDLILILDRNSISADSYGDIGLKLEIRDISEYVSDSIKYHTLTVDLNSNQVLIDNEIISPANYILYINKNVIPSRQKLVINTAVNNVLYTKGNFYINNLYFSDSSSFAAVLNNFNTQYSKQGTFLKAGQIELLKDASIKFNTTQSYTTKNDFNVTGNLDGAVTLYKIKLQSDVNTKYSTENNIFYVAQAGHSVQTENPLLKTISFNESYRFDSDNYSTSKTDSITFAIPNTGFKIFGKTSASDSFDTRAQNFLISENFVKDIGAAKFNFDTSIQGTQKVNALINDLPSLNSEDYFKGWYEISKLEFSLGEDKASNRNIIYKLNTGLAFNQVTPYFDYSAGTTYLNSNENKYTLDQNLTFKVPFRINKQSFSLNYSKKGTDSLLNENNGNYLFDSDLLFNNIANRTYFYKAIPFAELFSKQVPENLKFSTGELLYSSYSSQYEFEWRRTLFNSVKDLYIPGGLTLAVERDTKLSDTLSDFYQIKLSLNSSAINIFGTKSPEPVFNWFESDELFGSLSGSVKLPADDLSNAVYNISFYQQFLIYINQNSSLKTAFDFQIDTEFVWSSRATIIYTRPGKSSFLVDFAKFVTPKLKDVTFTISQKETGNIYFGKTSTQYFQQYDYLHTTTLSFLKSYSLNFGLGGTFTWNQITACSFALNMNLGGKMQF